MELKPDKAKPDKIPYRINGIRADATNPDNFSDFNDTVNVCMKGGYTGIGMGCFAPMELCDIDDCIVDGKFNARGQDIVDTLDSYTKLSPSGNGINISFMTYGFSYDTSRYYINNRSTHVKVYDHTETGRFVTLTGKSIYGADVYERSAEL